MGGNAGRFVWYDLMTTDKGAAEAFYPKVTGWGTQLWDGGSDEMPPYTMWTAGDRPIGGVNHLPEAARAEGARPHWIAYVEVDDVDDTLSRAESKGASVVMQATDMPGVGRMAVFTDPQGAMLAIFTPESHTPAHDGDYAPGDVSWHELATTDSQAAWEFYRDLFGWERTRSHEMGEGGAYDMFGTDGLELGGMFVKPDEMPGPPTWVYYAIVDDLDASVAAVVDGGGTVVVEPMEVPGGDRIAQFVDPQGAFFALHEKASS